MSPGKHPKVLSGWLCWHSMIGKDKELNYRPLLEREWEFLLLISLSMSTVTKWAAKDGRPTMSWLLALQMHMGILTSLPEWHLWHFNDHVHFPNNLACCQNDLEYSVDYWLVCCLIWSQQSTGTEDLQACTGGLLPFTQDQNFHVQFPVISCVNVTCSKDWWLQLKLFC